MTANHDMHGRTACAVFEVESLSSVPRDVRRYRIDVICTNDTMVYRLPHPEAAVSELDRLIVPLALHELIPYAERYGIADDGYRAQLIALLDDSERDDLALAVVRFADALDDWLAGPEANSDCPTHEYVAFSALRMAVDEL